MRATRLELTISFSGGGADECKRRLDVSDPGTETISADLTDSVRHTRLIKLVAVLALVTLLLLKVSMNSRGTQSADVDAAVDDFADLIKQV